MALEIDSDINKIQSHVLGAATLLHVEFKWIIVKSHLNV